MWILCGTVFAASLLGSMHCVGMCGPFAILASSDNQRRTSAAVPAIAYSTGRLVTYTLVGILFGSFGLALNQGSIAIGVSFSTVQQTATYVAGALMIVIGLIALLRQSGVRIVLPSFAGRLQALLQKHFQTIVSQPPLRKAYLIGTLSCLMPCGWLYTFAIVAAGTASPWQGGLVMIAFWAGTVPLLFALVMGFGKIGRSFQRRVPLAMATMVILIGVFTLAFRAPVAIGGSIPAVDVNQDLVEQVQTIDHAELPCCREE